MQPLRHPAFAVDAAGAGAAGLAGLAQHVAPEARQPADASASAASLRIGLIPERDIFAQRARYRALADYLAARLGRPVELVTLNSYENILRDFADRQVDAAFLGSLVAVLAADRLDVRILVKSELPDGATTYR